MHITYDILYKTVHNSMYIHMFAHMRTNFIHSNCSMLFIYTSTYICTSHVIFCIKQFINLFKYIYIYIYIYMFAHMRTNFIHSNCSMLFTYTCKCINICTSHVIFYVKQFINLFKYIYIYIYIYTCLHTCVPISFTVTALCSLSS
jgi:hypothetical protein